MSALPGLTAVVHPHALLAQAQLAAAARPPMGPSAAQQQQQQQQQMRAASANDASKKLAGKKRKAQEKGSGEKAFTLIPESALFNRLVMQERELDHQIKRHRLTIQAAAAPYDHPAMKRLRIYIYATHSNQPAAVQQSQQQQHTALPLLPRTSSSGVGGQHGSSSSLQEPPCWTLNLWGRVVDLSDPTPPSDSAAAAMSAAMQASAQPKSLGPPPTQQQGQNKHHAFTSFFKRIEVQLDEQQYPDDVGLFVWEKFRHRGAHKDKLEIKRIGSSNVDVKITLEQEFVPQAYKLAPELAELIGVTFGQQNSVLARVWSYIQNQKPQEQNSPYLQLDEKLAKLFGCNQLVRDALPSAVGKLMQPIEPLTVQYKIDVSAPSPSNVLCLDVDVLLPLKQQERVVPTLDALLDDKQFEAMDQKLSTHLNKLYETRRRRALYLGFAENPVAIINSAIASQACDLRVSRMGGAAAELERRTEAFSEKWVEEAAAQYLGKRNKAPGFV